MEFLIHAEYYNMRCYVIDEVVDYIKRARAIHPEVADDVLMKDEADTSALPYTIYYMNGNDGTDFDFSCNKRTCEFMVFYKKSKMGFLKVSVNDDNTIDGYCYGEGQLYPFEVGGSLERESIDENADVFACQLQIIADDRGLYDMPISALNFSATFEYDPEWKDYDSCDDDYGDDDYGDDDVEDDEDCDDAEDEEE